MLKHPGNHLGDSWYFIEGETIHCYYLTCPNSIKRHTAWSIGHAVSRDLVNWTIEDILLRPGEPGSYDEICLATGSVIKAFDRYWMAYTGNWQGPSPSAALAVSDDLYHWEKVSANPITTIDPRYYDANPAPAPRNWPHWRDPFLFSHDGQIYHYVCARLNHSTQAAYGALGLAATQDMHRWQTLPPPYVDPVTDELECPQVYQVNGLYYLIFSSSRSFFTDEFRSSQFDQQDRWTGYAMVGKSPFGPFAIHGNGEIIPIDYPNQPYAVQVVFWKEQAYLMGTVWNDVEDFLTDPLPLTFTETGVELTTPYSLEKGN
jgi:beta-fructofuranosidase